MLFRSEVINLISLRPIDKETIVESVKKTGRILNVEEGWVSCGIGSEITAIVVEEAFDFLDAEPQRITGADVPMPYAEPLEKLATPDALKIADAVRKICKIN